MKLRTDRVGAGTAIVALIGWCGVIGAVLLFRAEVGHWNGPTTAGSVILFVFTLPFAAFGTLMLLFGAGYLEIDPIAGIARLTSFEKEKWSSPLADLGRFSIVEKGGWHRLVAEGRPEGLFESKERTDVTRCQAQIEAFVAQSAIRKILEVTPDAAAPGGLRDAPDALGQAKLAVPDAAQLQAAIATLAADEDTQIRARALELQQALDRAT